MLSDGNYRSGAIRQSGRIIMAFLFRHSYSGIPNAVHLMHRYSAKQSEASLAWRHSKHEICGTDLQVIAI